MLQKTTQEIAFFLLKTEMLLEEDIEWFIYLLKKWILTGSIFIVLFFEGLTWASPTQIILYLVSLVLVRRRSGGFHAKTPLRCAILSMLIEMTCFIVVMKIKNYFFFNIVSFCFGESVLWNIFPKQKNKLKEIQANRVVLKKILILESLILIAVIILFKTNYIVMKNLSYWNMGILTAAISVVLLKWKEDNQNEQVEESSQEKNKKDD